MYLVKANTAIQLSFMQVDKYCKSPIYKKIKITIENELIKKSR